MPISDHITEEHIDRYIGQVKASGVFGRSNRRIRLLSHLMRSELLGQGDRLKAYSIGLDIFDKKSSFDPSTDSIVRVEMGRLRTAIALFEAGEYANTTIHVEIGIGTYRPTITLRETVPQGEPEHLADIGNEKQSKIWPTKLLLALAVGLAAAFVLSQFLFTANEHPTIGVQVTVRDVDDGLLRNAKSALTRSLSHAKTIRVLDGSRDELHKDANFELKLDVLEEKDGYLLTGELYDVENQRLVWSKPVFMKRQDSVITTVERTIGRELRVRLFGASKEILEKLDPATLPPEALFVLSTWVPGVAQSAISWEMSRIDLAEKALEIDPDFGAAHSVIADKLAYLANVYGLSDTAENRARSAFHARRAMDLSPLDPDVVFNVAQSHWHSGRIKESEALMSRVIELDPNHELAQFLARVIPYTCATASDEVLQEVMSSNAAISADNPIRWLTLTWIGWLHAYRGEWAEALEAEDAAARIFQVPYSFMRRAMVLNKLGRSQDAIAIIQSQEQSWADFDPLHFANVSIPRLCSENPDGAPFIALYTDLTAKLPNN